MKMRTEMPPKAEVDAEQKPVTAEQEAAIQAGMSLDKADEVGLPVTETQAVRNQNIEEMRKNAEAKAEAAAATNKEEVLPTLDISVVRAKIKEVEDKAAKQGWWKRQFTDTGETVRRLQIGLRKIEDPRLKVEFEPYFQEAFRQGGEEFAMEYLEDIGAGKLVKPVDGVLMVTGKRSQENLLNNN